MKALCCLALLVFPAAWADEAADRIAIERAIAAVNEVPAPDSLFTTDSDVAEALKRIWRDNRPAGTPTVTISHEPWGEATIGLPIPPSEIVNPRIESRSIRFLTRRVALADGVCVYRFTTGTRTTPLLFVMVKEGERWKIASLRLLAHR